jgi:hypothetical protein
MSEDGRRLSARCGDRDAHRRYSSQSRRRTASESSPARSLPFVAEDQQEILHFHDLRDRFQLQIAPPGRFMRRSHVVFWPLSVTSMPSRTRPVARSANRRIGSPLAMDIVFEPPGSGGAATIWYAPSSEQRASNAIELILSVFPVSRSWNRRGYISSSRTFPLAILIGLRNRYHSVGNSCRSRSKNRNEGRRGIQCEVVAQVLNRAALERSGIFPGDVPDVQDRVCNG